VSAEQELAGTAYSYVRFSSPEQESGDSVRRQRHLLGDWLKRHPKVVLDTGLTLEDRGVSAHRGKHRSDKYALGQFVQMVFSGRVPRGSLLVVENLDRLSREEVGEAVEFFLSIVNRGVRVVQLMPHEQVFAKPVDLTKLIVAVVELARAGSESAAKSERLTEKWAERKRLAAEGKGIVTARCPAWLAVRDGKFEFLPGARDTVRRIYAASRAGHGSRAIARQLLAAGVPHFCNGVWNHTYVRELLVSRSVVGEMQAYRRVNGKRVKDGPPVRDYFPQAVRDSEWHATQRARATRRNEDDAHKRGKGGRRGPDGWVRLFSEVYDARTGDKFQCVTRVARDRQSRECRRYRVLQQGAVGTRGAKACTFPLADFEAAIIHQLEELDPAEVFPPSDDGGRLAALSERVAEYEGRIARLQAAMVEGEKDETALPVLRQLDARRQAAAAELAAYRRDAASPASEEWTTLKGLASRVEADNEVRVRVRAVVARLVARIDCLVVPKGDCRLMAAQVAFKDTAIRRGYLVVHRVARRLGKDPSAPRRPSCWRCWSFADALGAGKLDLRDPAHVAALEKRLGLLDPDDLLSDQDGKASAKCPARKPRRKTAG
jgi:DNA invertase Pin-like site-specific DNA recombinase